MSKNKTYTPLKIEALDKEDLDIFSACLQDALIPLSGILFDKDKGCLQLIANRFCWECQPEEYKNSKYYNRVQSQISIYHVKDIKRKALPLDAKEGFVNLLTIHNTNLGCISLVFSGGAEIKLEVDNLRCLLKDIDEPYPTHNKPHHPITEDPSAS